MGAASSSNTTKNLNKTVTSATSYASQKSISNNAEGVKFDINVDGGGLVNFTGNTFSQTIIFDGSAFATAVSDATSQIDVQNIIVSSAKAEVSGINFGNVSSAKNIVENINQLYTTSVSSIKQDVQSMNYTPVDIKIDATDGGVVNFENNDFETFISSTQTLIANAQSSAISNSQIITDTTETAEASTVGIQIDVTLLLILIVVFFFIIIVIPLFLAKSIIKKVGNNFFIILAVVLVILIIIFGFAYFPNLEGLTMYGYSGMEQIADIVDGSAVDTVTNFKTPTDAAQSLLSGNNKATSSNVMVWSYTTRTTTYYKNLLSGKKPSQNDVLSYDDIEKGNVPAYDKMDWVCVKEVNLINGWGWGLLFVASLVGLIIVIIIIVTSKKPKDQKK